jgi:hypothetical protein
VPTSTTTLRAPPAVRHASLRLQRASTPTFERAASAPTAKPTAVLLLKWSPQSTTQTHTVALLMAVPVLASSQTLSPSTPRRLSLPIRTDRALVVAVLLQMSSASLDTTLYLTLVLFQTAKPSAAAIQLITAQAAHSLAALKLSSTSLVASTAAVVLPALLRTWAFLPALLPTLSTSLRVTVARLLMCRTTLLAPTLFVVIKHKQALLADTSKLPLAPLVLVHLAPKHAVLLQKQSSLEVHTLRAAPAAVS